MSRLKSRSLASLLKNKGFSHIQAEITRRKLYTQQLRAILPASMAAHCQVVNLQQDSLSIAVDNAAWLAKLRFLLPQIKQIYRQEHHLQLKHIKLLVSRPTDTAVKQASPQLKRQLSANSVRFIHDYAESLEPSDLRLALLRLSSRKKR
ncbi:MAG TPA: DUF721 domain-containing protein [Gammaproteobacteria bacterium]|nr:DUF721 domain-containing protein [Gammaproteobacteria bacterium]